MNITIDSAGRLVIPKSLRDEAGLKPGIDLEIRIEDGRIEIEPVAIPALLKRKGRFLVAAFPASTPPLKEKTVRKIIKKIRHRKK